MKNTEEKGKEAFDLHKKIAENENNRRKLLAQNAKLLDKMISEGLFRVYLGDEEAQPAAYYAQLDVFYSRIQMKRLIALERILCQKLGVDINDVFDIPDSRLSDIVGVATSENVNDLLDYARTMIPKDWKEEIRKLKKLPIPEDCKEHELEMFSVCKHCGEKKKN